MKSSTILVLLLSFLASAEHPQKPLHPKTDAVPLEMHIMGLCPDANDCYNSLFIPALPEIADIIEPKLSFIGKLDKFNNIDCKHGPLECMVDMLHLCAWNLEPPHLPSSHTPNSNKGGVGFSKCMLERYNEKNPKKYVPSCAESAGINLRELSECVGTIGDNGGVSLLKKSIERSNAGGIKTSCTVRLAGKVVCVRDDGKWVEGGCKDGKEGVEWFVKKVKEVHDGSGGEEAKREDL
jgi:hypothetical protein